MNCDIFEEGDGELHMRYKIDPIECREINYENAFEVSVEITKEFLGNCTQRRQLPRNS